MGKTIDVFIAAGNNSTEYAVLLRKTMLDLSSGHFDLRFKCIINSDEFDCIDGWETVEVSKPNHSIKSFKGIGSYMHGLQLNKISKYIDADFVVIADADTAVLSKNWDATMTEFLSRKKCAIAGVVASNKNDRYRNFPQVIFLMSLGPLLKMINPDFLPSFKKKNRNVFETKIIRSSDESVRWGYPQGTSFRCDTGWRLPFEYRSRGYNCVCLKHGDDFLPKNTRSKLDYEIWFNADIPFVAHAGWSRSSTPERFQLWSKFVNNLLTK